MSQLESQWDTQSKLGLGAEGDQDGLREVRPPATSFKTNGEQRSRPQSDYAIMSMGFCGGGVSERSCVMRCALSEYRWSNKSEECV